MSGHSNNTPIDYLIKVFIVGVLLSIVILLNYYVPHGGSSAALIALGFVILAAYLIGELVEIIKLPHITGYLLAGLVLGPSLAHTLHDLYPSIHLIAPFDNGLINEDVIKNLGVLDTLALPLICLTAGSALNPKEIWSAIRPIMGILFGQIVTMFVGMIGLVYCLSGILPVQIDAFVGLPLPALLCIGGLVGAISLATSDAATIAIVVSSKAKGPMTTNIISVAVLKDVVVVITFAAMTTLAMGSLGLEGGKSLGTSIQLIFLSAALGIVLGGVIHLYLRYVKEEVLLFLTALIYTVSFVSDHFHLESALMFIVAGFLAKNWSEYGDELITEVERLSAPVFVVFFTLAGAQLHLDVLAKMAVVALLLAGVRALAFFIGVRLGAIVFQADEGSRRYGWMGFVSQAGLAITLAKGMPETYGPELGAALFSFILGGVAINEVIGPAMLQSALGLAGELPKEEKSPEGKVQKEKGWFVPTTVHPEILSICVQVQEQLQKEYRSILERIEKERIVPLEEASKNSTHELLVQFCSSTTVSTLKESRVLDMLELISASLPDHLVVPFENCTFEYQESDGRILSVLLWAQKIQVESFNSQRVINPRNIARLHLDTRCAKSFSLFLEAQIRFDIAVSQSLRDDDIEGMKEHIHIFRGSFDELESDLSLHHRQFCFDLINISTARLPARALQNAFDDRNMVVHLFRFDIEKIESSLQKAIRFSEYEQKQKSVQVSLSKKLEEYTQEKYTSWNSFLLSLISYIEELNGMLSDKPKTKEVLETIVQLELDYLRTQDILSQTGSLFVPELSCIPHTLARPLKSVEPSLRGMNEVVFRQTSLHRHLCSLIENRIAPRFYSQFASYTGQGKRLYQLLREQREIVDYAIEQGEGGEGGEGGEETVLVEPLRRSLNRFQKILEWNEQDALTVWRVENEQIIKDFSELSFYFRDLDDIIVQAKPILTALSDRALSFHHWLLAWQDKFSMPRLKDPIEHWEESLGSYLRLFDKSLYEQTSSVQSHQNLKESIQSSLNDAGIHVLLGSYDAACSLAQTIITDETVFHFHKEEDEHFLKKSGKKNVLMGLRWLFRDKNKQAPLAHFVRHLMEHPEQSWLIIEDQYVWNVMSKKFLLTNFVNHEWILPSLSREELAEVLLARHQLSGFAIQYPEGFVWERIGSIHEEDPKQRFFSYLYKKSMGDVDEAFLLWMSAIESVRETSGVLVMMEREHGICSSLESLSVSHLLLLRQLLQYGWLDVDLVQQFFCCTQEIAEAWLSFLKKERFIYAEERYWLLRTEIRFSLIAVLQKRGWL